MNLFIYFVCASKLNKKSEHWIPIDVKIIKYTNNHIPEKTVICNKILPKVSNI